MPQLLRPPRPIPAPLEPSPPLDPAAMPGPPPPSPLAVVEDEKRARPPMKMKLLCPYAVNCVFGGLDRAWNMALLGLLVVACVVWVFAFITDSFPEVRFWILICVYLGIAGTVLMTFVEEAATAVDLPPPPPEMDMC